MKPENWKDFSAAEATRIATELFESDRGAYLVGQALAIASMVLETRGEESNAEDIEMMGETLFKPGYQLEQARLAVND